MLRSEQDFFLPDADKGITSIMITKIAIRLTQKSVQPAAKEKKMPSTARTAAVGAAVLGTGMFGKEFGDWVIGPVLDRHAFAGRMVKRTLDSDRRSLDYHKRELAARRTEHINEMRRFRDDVTDWRTTPERSTGIKKEYKDLFRKAVSRIKGNIADYTDSVNNYSRADFYKSNPSLSPMSAAKSGFRHLLKSPNTYKNVGGAIAAGALGGLAIGKIKNWAVSGKKVTPVHEA